MEIKASKKFLKLAIFYSNSRSSHHNRKLPAELGQMMQKSVMKFGLLMSHYVLSQFQQAPVLLYGCNYLLY